MEEIGCVIRPKSQSLRVYTSITGFFQQTVSGRGSFLTQSNLIR